MPPSNSPRKEENYFSLPAVVATLVSSNPLTPPIGRRTYFSLPSGEIKGGKPDYSGECIDYSSLQTCN